MKRLPFVVALALRRSFAATLLLAAGCGGSTSSSPAPPVGTATPGEIATAIFNVTAPRKTTRTTVVVSDTPASGKPTRTTQECPSFCEVLVNAPLGSNAFLVSVFATSGELLSAGATTVTIRAGVNDVALMLDPVVTAVVLPYLTAVPRKAAQITRSPRLFGPDGSALGVAAALLDAKGNPVTITVALDDPSHHTTISGAAITKPGQAFTLRYNGGSNTLATLTASASDGAALAVRSGSFAAATLTDIDLPPTYAVLGSIATGPSGAIWAGALSERSGDAALVEFLSNGDERVVPLQGTGLPTALTYGPNGTFWLTSGSGPLYSATPQGKIVATIPIPYAQHSAIAVGPHDELWITDPASVVYTSPTGKMGELQLGARAFPDSIVNGQDGFMYFNVQSAPLIERATTSGYTPIALPGYASQLAVDNHGDVWFIGVLTSRRAPLIGSRSPTGTITTYALPATIDASSPLSAGPGSVMWFDDLSLGPAWIDASGHVGVFPVDAWNTKHITAMQEGRDGALWMLRSGRVPDQLLRLAF